MRGLISMNHEYVIKVRGYELDSFNHVNNAIYINYFEAARWELFHFYKYNDIEFTECIKNLELHAVVVETRIKYLKELRLFDEVVVKSKLYYWDNFLYAVQSIYSLTNSRKIATAIFKMVFVTESDRVFHDIPDFIKDNLEEVDVQI